jgi:hypothetical protein
MWKYLVGLVLLLSVGVTCGLDVCTDCYANIITQTDSQTIKDVILADSDVAEENLAVGNEALSAAIIVTPTPAEGTETFKYAGFARIDQAMDQTISGLGTIDPTENERGAKGVTWNKAIQSAWIANQGLKENESVDAEGNTVWVKEGAYISQNTTQITRNIYDYDSREGAKILNLDNKLAMIVDDLKAVINLTAEADAATTDSQSSTATITNEADVDIDASTTGYTAPVTPP